MITISLMNLLFIILLVAVIMIACVMIGAFIMFKGRQTAIDAGFFGGVPKGDVFSIPEAEGAADFPDADSTLLDRTKQFLDTLGGGTSNESSMS